MGLSPDLSIALVAAAPLLAGLAAPATHRLVGPLAGWVLATIPASVFLFLCGLIGPIVAGETLSASIPWARGIALSFRVDELSLVFALAVSGIGTLVLVHAGTGLAGHPHQGRLMGFLLGLTGTMLGLVLADSMLVLAFFWMAGPVAAFLAIGFDHARQAARRAAFQALAVPQMGGLALLGGAVLVHVASGGWEVSGIGGGLAGHPLAGAVLTCVLVAALTASGQFPFQFWLPNTAEAPASVSALIHSAALAPGGIYLLARTAPFLGDMPGWGAVLAVAGAVTLAWGVWGALRQTDLGLMLARTSLAAFGLMILALGLGGASAIGAVTMLFLAHALYKAGLLMLVGTIDHGTGTREITALGGLIRRMPLSFFAAILLAVSMAGLPASLGWVGIERVTGALAGAGGWRFVALALLVVGQGALAGIGAAVALRVFLGAPVGTPRQPREGSLGLLAGPLVLGGAGIGLVVAAGTVWGEGMALMPDPSAPGFWIAAAGWGLGAAVCLRLGPIRSALRRFDPARGWSFEAGFDALVFGLVRLSAAMTRILGRVGVDGALAVVFGLFATALLAPVALRLMPAAASGGGGGAEMLWVAPGIVELMLLGIAIAGLGALILARGTTAAVAALGVQGVAVALLMVLWGAAGPGLVQLAAAVLLMAVLALVGRGVDWPDSRSFERVLRDVMLAGLCGAGVTLALLGPGAPMDGPQAGEGLFDRAMDSLGVLAVLGAAGIACAALMRRTAPEAPSRRRRRAGARA